MCPSTGLLSAWRRDDFKSDRGAAGLADLTVQDMFTGDGLEPGPRMSLLDRERESRHSAKGGHAKVRCWGWI